MDESFALQVAHAIAHLLSKVAEARDREVKAQCWLLQTLNQRSHGCELCHLQCTVTQPCGGLVIHTVVAGWL